jgi:hypothetical protein
MILGSWLRAVAPVRISGKRGMEAVRVA